MNIKRVVPNINKYIKTDLPYISPSEDSHSSLCVPEIIFQYGNIKTTSKSIKNLWRYLSGSIKQVKKSYKDLYNQPLKASTQILKKDLDDLNTFSKELGVGDIGFTKVDTSYIFSNSKILYPNAIVFMMEMNPSIIESTPSKEAQKEIFRTYYELNIAVNKIKEFLNKRGYRAEAGPALGGEVNYPLLAQRAGLGVIGKHGLLITPEFGPSLRIAAVYTDIDNLPLNDINEHLWIKDFCKTCNRCVKKCPAQAIYKDTKVFDNDLNQYIDYKKCAVPFSQNQGCTICVKECVFFKAHYSRIKTAFFLNKEKCNN